MAELNLSDYVLENKTELGELADAIRDKSGVTGSISVKGMRDAVADIYVGDGSEISAIIDRSIVKVPIFPDVIGKFAFADCINITDVAIPDNVTNIQNNAFRGCTGLKKFSISNSEHSKLSFGQYVFQDCSGLENFDVPDSKFEYLTYGMFQRCSGLKRFVAPFGIKQVQSQAFQDCSALEELVFPPSMKSAKTGNSLSSKVCQNCTALKKVVFEVKPEGGLATTFFEGCTQEMDIYVPWGLDDVAGAPWGAVGANVIYCSTEGVMFSLNGDGKSYTVTGFDNEYLSADGERDIIISSRYNGYPVTAIGDGAFNGSGGYNPLKIKNIFLPDTIKRIGNYAFADQTFESIRIPDSVTEIGDYAFVGCLLKSVELGAGCKKMPANVFCYCDGLTSISAPWKDDVETNAPWGAVNAEITYDETYGTYGLTYALIDDGYEVTGFEFDDNQSSNAVVIPAIHNGRPVVAIGDNAFKFNGYVCSVELPDSITRIGNYAFSGLHWLYNIDIPDSVTSIGECAFSGCDELMSIDIQNVTNIGKDAFKGCYSLKYAVMSYDNRCAGSIFDSCISLNYIFVVNSDHWGFSTYGAPNATVLFDYAPNGSYGLDIEDRNGYKVVVGYTANAEYVYIPRDVDLIDTGAFKGTNIKTIVCFGRISFAEDICETGVNTLIMGG